MTRQKLREMLQFCASGVDLQYTCIRNASDRKQLKYPLRVSSAAALWLSFFVCILSSCDDAHVHFDHEVLLSLYNSNM